MPKIAGMDVSPVGLGCNNFGMRIDEDASAAVVAAALDAGITLFDTADIYGGARSEGILGRALGARRGEVVLATKFGMRMPDGSEGAHPDYVRSAVQASLTRLGTDYLDLYQLHRPDPEVPLADTLGALQELVKAGLVRAIGCSNFSPELLEQAAEIADDGGLTPFSTVQNEYSLLHREPERGLLAACQRLEVGFLPYFPLASGLLTGKYRRGQGAPAGTRLAAWGQRGEGMLSDDNFDILDRLERFAAERGHTLLELAMSWLAARPAMTSIIAGATSPEQVRANVAAATWQLTPAEIAEVDALAPPP